MPIPITREFHIKKVIFFIAILVIGGVCVAALTVDVDPEDEPDESSRPVLSIRDISGGKPVITISRNAAVYDEVFEVLPPPNNPGEALLFYDVDTAKYDEVMAIIRPNPDPAQIATEEASLARWEERHVHWDAIDAFKAHAASVSADQAIDLEEAIDICFMLPQREGQMLAALSYVEDYRVAEPDFVAQEGNGLLPLEREAKDALVLIEQMKLACE